ncbi:uncharacterized protein [Onthophagus taurus]|uniref:uncharacterized protein n=1 Tax=Onthophagus taurus TaxID=166361 RepID=UPI0039BEA3F2
MCLKLTIYVCLTFNFFKITDSACIKNITCISLPSCAPFMKVITKAQKPLKLDLVKILRSQECDFELGYPKVCCSNSPFKQNYDNSDKIKFPSGNDKPNTSSNNAEVILPSTEEAEKIRQKKIEDMNKVLIESGIMDFIGFDLFRRKKNGYLLYMVDVEIR